MQVSWQHRLIHDFCIIFPVCSIVPVTQDTYHVSSICGKSEWISDSKVTSGATIHTRESFCWTDLPVIRGGGNPGFNVGNDLVG